jgi:DNA-directed RNA polymerase III subunit RPC1
MLKPAERQEYILQLRYPDLEPLARDDLFQDIMTKGKRMHECPFCGAKNGIPHNPLLTVSDWSLTVARVLQHIVAGSVKKVGPKRLVHFICEHGKSPQEDPFLESFKTALTINDELAAHMNRAQETLDARRVWNLFRAITAEDCELLNMNVLSGRPEDLLITHMLVPPLCIRPSIISDGKGRYERRVQTTLTHAHTRALTTLDASRWHVVVMRTT